MSTVVLLHGFTGDAKTMEPLADRLAARGHRTTAVDLVGHGKADKPSDPTAYSMASTVAGVHRVAATLDGPVVLLGYSMGGRVALATAAESPGTVQLAGLVLIGASAGVADPTERAERIAADEALADRIEHRGLEAFVNEWMANPLFATQTRLGDVYLTAARAQRMANDPRALALSLRGMGTGAQPPLHDRLGSIETPTLLIVGELDTKFRRIADELAAVLPRAQVAVVPRAGHAAHVEEPEATATAIDSFIRTHELGAAATLEGS